MSPRLLILSIAPLFAATTAYAQAPGEMQAPGNVAPMDPQPFAQDPCVCSGGAGALVMARRWAVGLSMGSLELAPKDNPDAKTQFAMAQLSIRFRATPHIELEVALAGGAQKFADGTDGNLAMNSATLGARYRFNPEGRWNWWLMAGFGATVVAAKDSTQAERDQLTRPHGTVGIGIERRWTAFALQAELRGIGMGDNPNAVNAAPPMTTVSGGSLPPNMKQPPGGTPVPPNVYPTTSGPQSGGSVTIGASYYF